MRVAASVLKSHSAEVWLLVVTGLAWLAATCWVSWQLQALNQEYPGCLSLVVVGADCSSYVPAGAAWDRAAGVLQWLGLGVVVIAGVALGTPIVAREVESGAAQVSWAIAQSRARWLLASTVPLIVVLIALATIVSTGAELLARARVGFEDPGFFELGLRGVILVVRAVLAFAIGCFAGAWLGRLMPAILAALLLIGAATTAGVVVIDQLQASAATLVRVEQLSGDTSLLNGRSLGQVAVLPDGTVTRERDMDKLPAGTDFDWFLIVPSTQVPGWIAVESALLGTTSLLVFAGCMLATGRRKPY